MTVDLSHPANSPEPAARSADPAEASGWTSWLGREGLLVVLVGSYAGLLLAAGQFIVSTDSWYALVSGRLIAEHGLPSHNTLTLWAYGAKWVDQQWLGQLTLYELDRAGGIRLAVLTHIALQVGALAAAVVVARRRGADPRSVAIISAVALLPLVLSSAQLRTQSFAYPLFVFVIALITRRRPTTLKGLSIMLAIVVVWANLHGSAVLAAGLISMRGIAELRRALRAGRSWRQLGWLVAVLPWPALLLTPYFWSTAHYYRDTIFNPTLSHYLAQWEPSTLSLVSLPLFVLALGFLWLLGRAAQAYSGLEKAVGLVLVAFALLAARNWVWLSLFAVAFYPKALDTIRTARRSPNELRLNRLLGTTGIAVALIASVAALTRPQSWFTRDFPTKAANVVGDLARAHQGARVWATAKWGDWLLWQDPGLEGRVAFDARIELLSAAQVKRMALFSATSALVPQVRRQFGIIVVAKATDPDAYRTLRHEGPVAYDDGNLLVVSSLKPSA